MLHNITKLEYRDNERIKVQSHTELTMKKEVEEAAPSSTDADVEIGLNPIKDESGLGPIAESEPALLVKEEGLENSRLDPNELQLVQGTSTPADTDSVNESCSMCPSDLLNVKLELRDTNIAPTVLQHVDTHYKINQNTNVIKEENIIVDDCNKPMLCNSVKKESIEEKWTDRTSVATDDVEQSELFHIKEELEDTDLEIGPTVLQHMDSHHRTNQLDLNGIKQENIILNAEGVFSRNEDGQVVCSKVRNNTIENSRKVDFKITQWKSLKDIYRKELPVLQSGDAAGSITEAQLQHSPSLPSQPSTSTQARKRQTSNDLTGNYLEIERKKLRIIELKLSKNNSQPEQKSEDYNFLMSIIPQMEKLPAIQKLRLRNKINNALLEEMEMLPYGEGRYRAYSCQTGSQSDENNAALAQCNANTSMKRIVQSQIYTCDMCEKTFKTKASIRAHVICVHGSFNLICPKCNKGFRCQQYLRYHVLVVHGQQQHKCKRSEKVFKAVKLLANHIKYQHRNNTTDPSILYVCDYCSNKFKWKSGLVSHLQNMHGCKSYRCEICERNFVFQLNLSKHIKQTHEEHKRQHYRCDECMKVYKSKKSTRVHATESHKCTQCDKEFKCKLYLYPIFTRCRTVRVRYLQEGV